MCVPAARREDQSRLSAAASDYEQRLTAARGEWEAEKAQLAVQAQRELDAAKRQHEVNQVRVGWGSGVMASDGGVWTQRPAMTGSCWGVEHRRKLCTAASTKFVALLHSIPLWQEAWRAAASERARRELASREAALRHQLAAERDEELAAVVARLEEDALEKEKALQARGGQAGCTHYRRSCGW